MPRAIETRYKERLFRSRLEARYAVLFDALAIEWDYEPEGYDLGGGTWYLPDFFLRYPPGSPQRKMYPDAGYWVEIKPIPPSAEEIDKMLRLCQQTGHHGWFFCGPPGGESKLFVCTLQGDRCATFEPGLWHSAPTSMCSTIPSKKQWAAYLRAVGLAVGARFNRHGRVTP